MKKLVAVLLISIFAFSSCMVEKSDSNNQESIDITSSSEISNVEPETENSSDIPAKSDALAEMSIEQIKQRAFTLTKHLLSSVVGYSLEEKDEFLKENSLQIQNFILTTALFTEDEYSPYADVVTKINVSKIPSEPAYQYTFYKEKIERMLYEVFDITGWNFDTSNMEFDSDTNTYITGLEFEFGIYCEIDDEMESVFHEENNTLEVLAKVSYYGVPNSDGDPSWGEFEKVHLLYQICEEDGKVFLRLLEKRDSAM